MALNKKLSESQAQNLINDYQSGQLTKYLCSTYNICVWTLYSYLKEYDIPKIRHRAPSKLLTEITPQDIVKIESLYRDGYSSTEIGNIYDCAHTVILKILDTYTNEDHSRSFRIRTYKNVNQQYFDDINTEEKSYFLGLMFADGNVRLREKTNSQNSVYGMRITLVESDVDLLQKFSQALYGEIKLQYKQNIDCQNTYTLAVSSQHMAHTLNNLGCPPAKSLILEWPEWLIDPILQRHFIRGYFDGDGCISVGTKSKQYSFDIVSTYNFCISVQNIINTYLPEVHFKLSKHPNNNITKRLYTGGNRQVVKVMDWLYKDATIFMQRKYNKYLQLKAFIADVDRRLNIPQSQKKINQYG